MHPVGFKLKGAKPVWSWPYPVPKVHDSMFQREFKFFKQWTESEWVSLYFLQP